MKKIDILYVDLDGVLVNFELGIYNIIKEYIGEKRDKISESDAVLLDEMKTELAEIGYERAGELLAIPKYKAVIRLIIGMEPEWWTHLEWMPDGKELWEAIKKYNPTVLSSPLNKTNWQEKNTWVARELGDHVKVLIEDDKEIHADPGALLIDDRPHHSKFEEHGGNIIKHVSAKDSIRQLDNYDLTALEPVKAIDPVNPIRERRVFLFDDFVNESYDPSNAGGITSEELVKQLQAKFRNVEGKSEYEILTHDRDNDNEDDDEPQMQYDVSFEYTHNKKGYTPATDVVFIDTFNKSAETNFGDVGEWTSVNDLAQKLNKEMTDTKKSIFG